MEKCICDNGRVKFIKFLKLFEFPLCKIIKVYNKSQFKNPTQYKLKLKAYITILKNSKTIVL